MIKKSLLYLVLLNVSALTQSAQTATEYAHLTEEIITPHATMRTYVSSTTDMATEEQYKKFNFLNDQVYQLDSAREIFCKVGCLSSTASKVLQLLACPNFLHGIKKFESVATPGNKILTIVSLHGGGYPRRFRQISHHVTFTNPQDLSQHFFPEAEHARVTRYFQEACQPNHPYNNPLYSQEQKEKMFQIIMCLQSGTIQRTKEDLFVATYAHETER